MGSCLTPTLRDGSFDRLEGTGDPLRKECRPSMPLAPLDGEPQCEPELEESLSRSFPDSGRGWLLGCELDEDDGMGEEEDPTPDIWPSFVRRDLTP